MWSHQRINLLRILLLSVLLQASFIRSHETSIIIDDDPPPDLSSTIDEANWVDPNDPTSWKPKKILMSTGHVATSVLPEEDLNEQTCSKSNGARLEDDPSLRLILRSLMQSLKVDPSQRTSFTRVVTMYLSSSNVATIDQYLESTDPSVELALRNQVRSALEGIVTLDDETSVLAATQSLLYLIQPYVAIFNALVFPPCLYLLSVSLFRIRRPWMTFFAVVFLISMVISYGRQYHEKLAIRMADQMKRSSIDICRPPSFVEQALETVSGLVFFKQKDDCQKLIEAQMMPAIWEVNPMDAFVDVFANFLFGPLKALGKNLNEFAKALFHGLPPMYILTLVMIIFVLGVRINLPFLQLEPILITASTGIMHAITQALADQPTMEDGRHLTYDQLQELIHVKRIEAASRGQLLPGMEAPPHSQSTPALPALEGETTPAVYAPHVTKRTPLRQKRLDSEKGSVDRRESSKERRSASVNRMMREGSVD